MPRTEVVAKALPSPMPGHFESALDLRYLENDGRIHAGPFPMNVLTTEIRHGLTRTLARIFAMYMRPMFRGSIERTDLLLSNATTRVSTSLLTCLCSVGRSAKCLDSTLIDSPHSASAQ